MPKQSSFPRLTDLPAEIQLEIWKSALPGGIKPCLFPHATGCWEHIPGDESELVHHDQELPGVPYSIPMALADKISCETAIKWLKKNNFDPERQPDSTQFIRLFDPTIDALFFPAIFFGEATTEDYYNAYADHGRPFGTPVPGEAIKSRVRYLAVDDNYFRDSEWPCILEHCKQWPSVLGLFVVIPGEDHLLQDLLHLVPTNNEEEKRWEIGLLSDGKFVWDAAKMEYAFKGSKKDGYEATYSLLEQKLGADAEALKEDAADGLPVNIPDGFFVQPIVAIRGE